MLREGSVHRFVDLPIAPGEGDVINPVTSADGVVILPVLNHITQLIGLAEGPKIRGKSPNGLRGGRRPRGVVYRFLGKWGNRAASTILPSAPAPRRIEIRRRFAIVVIDGDAIIGIIEVVRACTDSKQGTCKGLGGHFEEGAT